MITANGGDRAGALVLSARPTSASPKRVIGRPSSRISVHRTSAILSGQARAQRVAVLLTVSMAKYVASIGRQCAGAAVPVVACSMGPFATLPLDDGDI